MQKKLKKKLQGIKKDVPTERKKKDPLFEIEGNQKLNKLKKLQFKKEKKNRLKRGMMKNVMQTQNEKKDLTFHSFNYFGDFFLSLYNDFEQITANFSQAKYEML